MPRCTPSRRARVSSAWGRRRSRSSCSDTCSRRAGTSSSRSGNRSSSAPWRWWAPARRSSDPGPRPQHPGSTEGNCVGALPPAAAYNVDSVGTGPLAEVGRRASPCSPTGQDGPHAARIDDLGGLTDSRGYALPSLLAERADAVGIPVDVTGDVLRRWLAVAAAPADAVDDVLVVGGRLAGGRERSDCEERDPSDSGETHAEGP